MHKRGWHDKYELADEAFDQGGRGKLFKVLSHPGLLYKQLPEPDLPTGEQMKRLVGYGRVADKLTPNTSPFTSINWAKDAEPAPGDRVRGVFLPELHDRFRAPSGRLRTLEYLYLRGAKRGPKPPAAADRIRVVIRIAEVAAHLDALGLVHPDFNGNNICFSGSQVQVFDTDGMIAAGSRPAELVHTPLWTDPRVTEGRVAWADQYSNRYDLARMVYCVLLLTPGRMERDPRGTWPGPDPVIDQLPPLMAQLLHRGLDNPQVSRGRPAPAEFVTGLRDAFYPLGRLDRAAAEAVDTLIGYTPAPPAARPDVGTNLPRWARDPFGRWRHEAA